MHYDYVLMSAGGSTSEHFSPIFEQAGAIVIDNSSQWRMTEGIDHSCTVYVLPWNSTC